MNNKKMSYQDFLKKVAKGEVKTASDSLNHTARKKYPKKTLDEPAPSGPAGSPYGYFEMDGKKYENTGAGWHEILPDGRRKLFYRE